MNTKNIITSVLAGAILLSGSTQAKQNTQSKWAAILDIENPFMVGVSDSFESGDCKLVNGQKIYVLASKKGMPSTDAYYTELSQEHIAVIRNSPACTK